MNRDQITKALDVLEPILVGVASAVPLVAPAMPVIKAAISIAKKLLEQGKDLTQADVEQEWASEIAKRFPG